MKTTINERFVQLLDSLGTNPSRFSKSVGKSYNAIESIIKGKTRPSYDVLESVFSSYPDISRDWLLMGEGAMVRKPEQSDPDVKQDNYLHDHLRTLEENFTRLAHQLEMKDQQIAGLQRTVDALVGKSESATVDPLFCDEVDMVDIEAILNQYKLSALKSMSGLFSAKPNIIQKPSLVKVVALS